MINFVESAATLSRLPDFTLLLLHPTVLNNQCETQSPGHAAPPVLPGKHFYVASHHPQTLELEQISHSVIYAHN